MLEDIFLNQLRRDNERIEIITQQGDFIGILHGFDLNSIIIDTEEGQTMLYKNNIIAIKTKSIVLCDSKKR